MMHPAQLLTQKGAEGNYIVNINKTLEKSHKLDFISLALHLELFSIKYRWKDFMFGFHVSEKINFDFTYPNSI